MNKILEKESALKSTQFFYFCCPMKKNISPIIVAACLLLFFTSCKNDFNIAAKWKDIPVVYGLLNADSSVQYVKIERAFLSQDASAPATKFSSNPDSIYYQDNLKVYLDGYDNLLNHVDYYTMNLVDGDTIGLPKQSGIFANTPNLFYRLKSRLNVAHTYKLTVLKSNGKLLASGSTNVVGSPSVNLSQLRLIYTVGGVPKYNPNVNVPFNGGLNAAESDILIRLYYYEFHPNQHDTIQKSIDWALASSIALNVNAGYAPVSPVTFDGAAFYEFIAGSLSPTTTLYRTIKNMDFIVSSANSGLVNYENVQNAQSGITSGNAQPNITNIQNGLGLLASASSVIRKGIRLTPVSLDSVNVDLNAYGFNHR
jgi:hypothetical protein